MQKILAAAGLGSRRDCEELITQGRVEVNRRVVNELGVRANPEKDEIRVDGVPLKRKRRLYFALNKPPGVVCTNFDPSGRTRVVDMIDTDERLFTIGRLDRSSEGLILVTNDGDLANRLTHPRYGVSKTYRVEVAGHPTPDELAPLRDGVRLAEGLVKVDSLQIRRRFNKSTELEIVLTEGINREIRRVLAKVGHKVLRLERVAIGRLVLGEMPTGAYRELTRQELETLLEFGESRRKPKRAIPKRNRAAGRPGVKPQKKTRPIESRRAKTETTRRLGAVISYDDEPERPKPKTAKKSAGKPAKSRRPKGKGKGKRRP